MRTPGCHSSAVACSAGRKASSEPGSRPATGAGSGDVWPRRGARNPAWVVALTLSLAGLSSRAAEPAGDQPGGEGTPPDVLAPELELAPTPEVPAPGKSFQWRGEWRGWDGFHFDLTRRTLFANWLPAVTNLPPLRPEVGWKAPEAPAQPRLDFHETRLTGKIGAKFAVDAAAYVADEDLEDFEAGAEVRRARFYVRGDCQIFLPVSYEIEVGYIPGRFYFENSYLEFRNLGFLGSLKMGQYQAPMSLVNYGSSWDTMFMESAAPIQALAPGVEAGLQFGRPVVGQRMTWAAGLFTKGTDNDFGDATQDFGRVIARVTGLPYYEHDETAPESQRLLHVGLSGYSLYAGGGSVRYQSRPESHLAPYLIDTGEIDADAAFVLGGEVAWVDGPLCLQGEYLHSWVRRPESDSTEFFGFYVSASWFLTGESRPYNPVQGTFTRVIPRRSVSRSQGGWGAWEVALRYSYTDLDSAEVRGGRLGMGMAGVNWYLLSHLKWRFNYGLGSLDNSSSDGMVHLFQTRVEVDF